MFSEAAEQRFMTTDNHLMCLIATKSCDLSTNNPLENDFVTDIMENIPLIFRAISGIG